MSPLCPRCQSPIVLEGEPPGDVDCPTCGSTVVLDPNATLDASASSGLTGATHTGGIGKAPKAFGKFELLDQLGAGAFGTVYKARDTELGRLVALKIPRAGNIPQREDQDRFLREAKSAAQLKHPGIVSLYDAATIDGTCCLVSEYVHGSTLADRLNEQRLNLRQAAKLIAETADALHYAHEHGVVHRDLKPSNIMLDLEGRPHVLDFGLAKRAAEEITMTMEGQVLGTPAYMSPEQARGESSTVDARTDIYSLGVILYELLTGELPFRGLTRMLLVQVMQDEPAPPRRLNDQIPRDLETICLKAMAKEPVRRYRTARDLADDLRRFLQGEPVRARPVGRVETAWRWCRRNPAVASLTAATAFLLLAGTAVSTYFAVEATLAGHRADANAAKESDERLRADHEAAAAWASQYIAHANRMETDWENANVSRILDTLDVYRKPLPRSEDLRGWEWYFQERLLSQEIYTFRGHTEWVRGVAYSPDGTRLASASLDHTVKLWDTNTGQEIRTLKGHTGQVVTVAFSPDGARLASAGLDQSVKLWDADTGQELASLQGHTGAIWSVVFGPDGKSLVTASDDQTVKLWDVETSKAIHTFEGHIGSVYSVAVSPHGTRLASAGIDQTVRLWDTATGSPLGTLQGHKGQVWSVAFSPDSTRLASSGLDGTIKLWESASGQDLHTLQGHRGAVWGVTFSPDGTRLASAGEDRTVKLWDTALAQELRTFKGHLTSVWSVAFSPDGMRLASASLDLTVKLWDASSADELPTLRGHAGAVWSVALSPDGTRLASAGPDKTIRLWDVATRQELFTLKGHTEPVGSVAISPDGTRVASASWDQTVKLWDAGNGRELHTLQGHAGPVVTVVFSPDGSQVASSSDDRTVKLWDAAAGQLLNTLKGHTRTVRSVAFSPDGKRLATASEDRTVKLWDAASGRDLRSLTGHTATVVNVAFSRDGTRLASASDDWTARLWDAASGQQLFTLKGHAGAVASVTFNRDGTRLASASRDGTVKLWDAVLGQELRILRVHTGSVWSVAFSADGTRLATASDDRTVVLWDARPVTPDVKAEVEAVSRLECLFRKPLPRSEVLAVIERDMIIGEAVRRKGLEFAPRFSEETDPEKYYAAAWPLMRHPYSNVTNCKFALAQMKAACQRAPDQEPYRIALAAAQYRLGRFEHEQYAETLATLYGCDQNHPLTLALRAMAQRQLGQQENARAALARLQEIMMDERWSMNADAQSMLREAQALIEVIPACDPDCSHASNLGHPR